MDPVANPYRPGAGRRPPLLAGREALLDSFDVIRRRAEEAGEGDRSWVLNGLRGVGKTVLLNELLARVSSRGWITAKVEAGAGTSLPLALASALARSMRTATGRHPEPGLRRLLGIFKAFTLKLDPSGAISFGIDVDAVPGFADSGRLGDDLAALFETLGETARDLGVGVLILVDELQEATSEELRAINTGVHHLGQAPQPLPLTFIGAGLPSLPAQLADATSYAERLYDYRSVGLLDDDAARNALVVPARDLDVDWGAEGLNRPSRLRVAIPISCNPSASTFGTTRPVHRLCRMTSLSDLLKHGGKSMTACIGRDGSMPHRHNVTCCVRSLSLVRKNPLRLRTSLQRWASSERRTFPFPATS